MSPGHNDVPAHGHVASQCQRVAPILARVGDKWSILVVMMLGEGPVRFNELRRRIGGVSQRMLTFTVRGLERDGLISRTVYPTIPPRVEYELTELGRSLLDPVRGLGQWVMQRLPEIETAQARFDRQNAKPASPVRPLSYRATPTARPSRAS